MRPNCSRRPGVARDLDALFAKGEFTPLREWLNSNVHKYGRQFVPSRLVERITGTPLSSSTRRPSEGKFEPIYGL